MRCKFLDHGVAVSYDHVAKPCCEWTQDPEWDRQNHISQVDLSTWHQSPQIIQIRNQLSSGQWPSNCQQCAMVEQQGRQDSMRGNSNQSYEHYADDDITLEIRPGSICNFACQTCWPEASSRVAQYHHQAGMINIKDLNSASLDNFEFLLPIAKRIKNIVVLGGEPFYDPNCKRFLNWAQQHLHATITMFTNGSHVDWTWVNAYPGKITMVFSIDAVGKPAEYVRFGTDWAVVHNNLTCAQRHSKIEVRVNITLSVYNYHLIEQVIDFLLPTWPEVVSFGQPRLVHLCESAIPKSARPELINSLQRTIDRLMQSDIEIGQQHNAVNAVQSVINNLQQQPFDASAFHTLKQFVNAMDQLKHINIVDSANPVDFS